MNSLPKLPGLVVCAAILLADLVVLILAGIIILLVARVMFC